MPPSPNVILEPVPVRVYQLITDHAAGYLIRCPRTNAAALVDPSPVLQSEYQVLMERHELKLRFVLRTSLTPPAEATRYGKMLASLGLGVPDAEPSELPDPYAEIALVGPASANQELRAAPEAMILQAGEGTVGVRLHEGTAPEEPRFTIGGSLLGGTPPTAHICGSARVALGAFFVDVLPLTESHVAYLVQDRLFSGTRLGRTDPTLLPLPPDTIVYPTHVSEEASVTTIGQERRARPGAMRSGEAVEWPG